uniref:sphingosine kinase n=1 Tax=Oryza nivara TaxID=4536 RepID=A0A0E0FU57_ORYNI
MGDHRATAKVRVNGAPAEATLFCTDPPGAANGGGGDGGELRWRCAGGAAAERVLSLDADVLGVEARGKEVIVKAFVLPADAAARSVSCAAGAGKGGGGRRRRRRDYVFEMAAGEDAAAAWCDRMRGSLDSLGRPKRLFILVNPFGGKKCGKKIYEAEIKPLFEAAGVNVTMQETRYQGHAREVASSLDLARYDGIVCVSGDGVLVEVVNGILQRMDWEEAMKIPIGVVPAGTGNGMAKSLLHSASKTYSVPNAVFAIIRGLVADIDIESEKYRWMGSARFDFYALVRIMNLRKYYGSSEWRSLDGPFVSIWINNVQWAAESIMAAPGAKFSDGYMDAVIVRDCPKADLLALLMKMGDGSHVKSPYVTYLKVRCLRLSPGQLVENPKRGGIIDVDGEAIARGEGTYGKNQKQDVMGYGPSIQMTVHRALATMYCPK